MHTWSCSHETHPCKQIQIDSCKPTVPIVQICHPVDKQYSCELLFKSSTPQNCLVGFICARSEQTSLPRAHPSIEYMAIRHVNNTFCILHVYASGRKHACNTRSCDHSECTNHLPPPPRQLQEDQQRIITTTKQNNGKQEKTARRPAFIGFNAQPTSNAKTENNPSNENCQSLAKMLRDIQLTNQND